MPGKDAKVRYLTGVDTIQIKALQIHLEQPKQPCLIRLTGIEAGRIYPLGTLERPVELGRSERCDICLDQPDLSRRHALIDQTEAGIRLTDLQSSNGTYLNGETVTTVLLRADDRIQFGSYAMFKLSFMDQEEIEHQQLLFQRAVTDFLTGLMNRDFFMKSLQQEWAFAQRHQTALAIAMLDLDYFKSVNDTYGHLVGDEVLVEFSKRVRQQIRIEDTLARFGGEEFILLFRDIDELGAICAARRVGNYVSQTPFQIYQYTIPVTVSIGVAGFCGSEIAQCTGDQLIDLADRELYRAKHSGRNTVRSRSIG